MAVCPLCNALQTLIKGCPYCQTQLEDAGKVSDFLDPYGHYNDDETVKMGDGYLNTVATAKCPHIFYCKHCGYDKVYMINQI